MKGNHIFLCGLLLLLMAACTDEKAWFEGGSQIIVNATLPGGQSPVGDAPSGMRRIALSQEEGSLNISTKWKDGDKIQLFVKQGNKMHTLSPSKVYNIGSDGKTCSFGFQLPSEVNAEKPYTIYGLCDVEGMVEDGVVKAKSQLRRVSWIEVEGNGEWPVPTAFAPMWFQTTGGASSIYAQFKHLGTYEVLHVKNLTNVGINLKHCGFEVGTAWYKYYESTPLDDNYNPTQYACEPGEAISNNAPIARNATRLYVSWYMPSGERISNARLLANIDGKNVKSSNTKSSNATIQRGHAYHMYAEWDGSELRFVDGSTMGLQLSTTSLTLTPGSQGTVDITSGSGSYDAVSNATNVATVTVDGSKIIIKAVSPGPATITVKDNQTQERAKIEVTVTDTPQAYLTCPDDHHPHLIDLGLPSGTKWACCNVDTDHPEKQSPTNYGGYYAWGETETKSGYSESTYQYYKNGSYQSLGSDISGTRYDVAHVKWGGSWVMPTKDQQDELRDNCTYEWMTVNGVNGGRFTSKINGGSIFLPAAGRRYGSDLYNAGSYGNYWSSAQSPSGTYGAYGLYFGSGYTVWDYYRRYYGQSVRPVVRN